MNKSVKSITAARLLAQPFLETPDVEPRESPQPAPFWMGALRKLTALDELIGVFRTAIRRSNGHGCFFGDLLSEADIRYRVEQSDLGRIPARGPVIVVANHPFGLAEGAILAALLPRIRPDFRIMVNSLLAEIPEFHPHFVFVNPYGGRQAIRENYRPLRGCLAWLRAGGMLVVFPAGAVSSLDWKERAVVDPPWNSSIGRLMRLAKCPALPIFFEGSNGVLFQLAGTVHRHLRTVSLPREFLNKRGKQIWLHIGRQVPFRTLESLSDREAIDYLRCRTYLLAGRAGPALPKRSFAMRSAPLAAGSPREFLLEEIAGLGEESRAGETEQFSVFLAESQRIPHVLREIGRLRELTFRGAGEGTGKSLDLDAFDRHYRHLFVWSKENRELVGAYRLGATPDLLSSFGVRGLYTSTLFRFRRKLFERLGPAIELGRSFVRPEYQKLFAPLLLLWKGIGKYVASRPECAVMFGAVSISRDYHPMSREMLASFLETQRAPDLACYVTARHPYKAEGAGQAKAREMRRFLREVDELSEPIADLEGDGRGVPILIKQYMKLGGRLLGLNVDPNFSNSLDVLIMVDLRRTPRPLLDRYLSAEGAARFMDFHRMKKNLIHGFHGLHG